MSSIISSFEYDIFISYRHNDNRSGWVSEFVSALTEELSSTIKTPVSIYFDRNPDDGLLETHHIDLSVSGKLRCLLFIPVLSQTYCDPGSFAWKNEFCRFNTLSKADEFGREIKLATGNVASRILPIRIHELDGEDLKIIEDEIGTSLRAIDFIYKEPGVNRPLKPGDNKSDNYNKTDYRNQINKVANAVKELLNALRVPAKSRATTSDEGRDVPAHLRSRLSAFSVALLAIGICIFAAYYLIGFPGPSSEPEKSIAVLPFENLTEDRDQEYFSSGMTEDILTQLCKISDLKVKSRTSTLQYRELKKPIAEIAHDLGVSNIVAGSVRKVGDRVRIAVQLIDAKNDVNLWTETYDRELNDILNLQSEIAIEIAETLEAKLTNAEKTSIEKTETRDITAYDYYLKAREELNSIKFTREELERLRSLIDQAIDKDSHFVKAYALKARLWFLLSSFGVPESTWKDSAIYNAEKAIAIDSTKADGYWALAQVESFLGRMDRYERNIRKAYQLNPNDTETKISYAVLLLDHQVEEGADLALRAIKEGYTSKQPDFYQLMFHAYYRAQDYGTALKFADRLTRLNPSSINGYFWAHLIYLELNELDKAEAEMIKYEKAGAIELPSYYDSRAWIAFRKQDYANAIYYWSKYKEIESKFEDRGQTVAFRHRLAMTMLVVGKTKEAKDLLKEQLKIQTDMINDTRSTGAWSNRGGLFYDLAVSQALLGQKLESVRNLDSAFRYKFEMKMMYDNDPAFESIKDDPAFQKVIARVHDFYSFRKRAFKNAIERAETNKEMRDFLER